MKRKKLKILATAVPNTTIVPNINPNELDDEPPNLLSNSINMRDFSREHSDCLNPTHIRYLLSLSDNDWKQGFTKKYSAKETKQWLNKYRKLLSTILEECELGDEEIEIDREYTIRGCNRLYCEGGIQTLERNLRNFIQHPSIKDYDMVNAQATILLYLTRKNGLPHTRLAFFCENRDEIFNAFGRQRAKDFINIALFMDKPKPCGNPDIDAMIQEYISNRNILIHAEKDKINPDKEPNQENPKGSDMSNILCYYENYILNSVIKRFPHGAINTLIFDGFYSKIDIPIDSLNELTQEWGIKWKSKPLETIYELPDDFDPSKVLTYKEQKRKFEKEVCLITFAENFKRRNEVDGTWVSMTQSGMKLAYQNWRTIDKEGKDIDFIDRWLKDKDRKDYNSMTFHPFSTPDRDITHPKEFNAFRGFKSKQLDRWVEDEEVKWFLEHLDNCFGDEVTEGMPVVEFLTKCFAWWIQKPHQKLAGIMVFRGYEGTGKDTLRLILASLIGDEYVYECEGMRQIITKDTWNDHLIDKILCVMNEVAGEDGVKNIEGLKQKATTYGLNVREKFMKNQTIKDINNLMILSNNNSPVVIAPTCRRYTLFQTNEELKGMTAYWTSIYNIIGSARGNPRDDEKMDQLFTWLLQQDISQFDFENDRPITESYKRLTTKNISEVFLVLYRKLGQHIAQHGEEPVEFSVTTTLFNKWCQYCSKEILERRETIRKSVISDILEKIPPKYIYRERRNLGSSRTNHWIVPDAKKLLKRLYKLEFKYFDPNKVDLEMLDDFGQNESDSD